MKKRVFISRKDTDKESAAEVREILDTYAGDAIEFISADDMPAGEDWFKWIGTQLSQADLLLVLTTHPSDRWEWVLYEAGWYTRFHDEEQPPLICMHMGDGPPDPLDHFQCVSWNDEKAVVNLLRDLYGPSTLKGLEEPINTPVATNDALLVDIAQRIKKAGGTALGAKAPVSRIQYNRFVDLFIKSRGDLANGLPDDARVSSDKSSLNIFGIDSVARPDGTPWTWQDLVNQVVTGTERGTKPQWLADLEKAVVGAVSGLSLDPIAGLLQAVTSAKMYRPNVTRVDIFEDGSALVKILFIQQPTPPLVSLPEKLDSLPEPIRVPADESTEPVKLTT